MNGLNKKWPSSRLIMAAAWAFDVVWIPMMFSDTQIVQIFGGIGFAVSFITWLVASSRYRHRLFRP